VLITEPELAYGKHYDKEYDVTSGLKHKLHGTIRNRLSLALISLVRIRMCIASLVESTHKKPSRPSLLD
jgi:hypothetical protein